MSMRLAFNLRLGGGQGGGGGPTLDLSLDNQTISPAAVEGDLVGNWISANGVAPYTDVLQSIVNIFAPNDIIFSDTSVDDGSTAGTVVCVLSSTRPNGTVTYSIVNDPDSKFAISGSNLILSEIGRASCRERV